MKSKSLLLIGILLIGIGVFRPNLGSITGNPSCPIVPVGNGYVTSPPTDPILLDKATLVTEILLDSNESDKKNDSLKLSSLYKDLSILIEIDNEEDAIVTDTMTLRKANSLAGQMLKLNIKGKYSELAEASKAVVVAAIGEEDIQLDSNIRAKAVEAFRALSWACYEGSK